MLLIGAIKHIEEKKFKTCFIFLRDYLGEFCFFTLAATKTLNKRKEKVLFRGFF